MLNEQKKSNNHRNIYVAVAVILLLAGIYSTLRSCGNDDAGTAELHQRTDAAVGAVEAEHATAGRELDTVGAELNSAKTAISRADELVERSQERITENTASINECQRIVSDCRKIVTDSNRIYCEVEEANRSGTGSCGGS